MKKGIVTLASVIIFIWLILVFVVGVLSYYHTRDKIVAADEKVNESFAQVENVLQRRFDLIPNLVNTVKGFAKQEKELLIELTSLRTQWQKAGSKSDKVKVSNKLENSIGKILQISENYPRLQSSDHFMVLQDQLEGSENRVSIERRRYNQALRDYNTKIRQFPANFMSYKKRDEYFKAVKSAKIAPKVKF